MLNIREIHQILVYWRKKCDSVISHSNYGLPHLAKMELQGLDLLSQLEQLKSWKNTWNRDFQTLDDRQHRTLNPGREWRSPSCHLQAAVPGAGPGAGERAGGQSCVSTEQRTEERGWGRKSSETCRGYPQIFTWMLARACVWGGAPSLGKGPPERNMRNNTWRSPH